jgi:hypothetical protein
VRGVSIPDRRHPLAGVGFALAVVWLVIVAIECFAVSPWDAGGWYAHAVETADLAWRGMAGIATFVWLVERASA